MNLLIKLIFLPAYIVVLLFCFFMELEMGNTPGESRPRDCDCY